MNFHQPAIALNPKLATHTCSWPDTCQSPALRHRSYCATHHAIATAPRSGDVQYVEALMGVGRLIAPGLTAEEAVALVRGRAKLETEE